MTAWLNIHNKPLVIIIAFIMLKTTGEFEDMLKGSCCIKGVVCRLVFWHTKSTFPKTCMFGTKTFGASKPPLWYLFISSIG